MEYCKHLNQLKKSKLPAKKVSFQEKVRCYKVLLPEEENVLLEIIRDLKDTKIRCAAIEGKNK